ncbi:MAG: hypothetical protein ACTSYY_08475, partial [Promethearchaeota archaeon]
MAKKKTSRKKTTRKKTVKKTSSKPKTKAKKKKIDNDDDFEEDGPEYIEEDLDELDDDMLADEGGVKKRSMDEIEMMLRDVECSTCEGNSSREN